MLKIVLKRPHLALSYNRTWYLTVVIFCKTEFLYSIILLFLLKKRNLSFQTVDLSLFMWSYRTRTNWKRILAFLYLVLNSYNFYLKLLTTLIHLNSAHDGPRVVSRIPNFRLTGCILSKVLSTLWVVLFAPPFSSSLLTWYVTSGRENHVVSSQILFDVLLVEGQIIGCVWSRTFDFTHSLLKKRKLSV